MSILQPILNIIHFIGGAFYYFFSASYFIGQNIFLLISQICGFIRDLLIAFAILGEEFYRFICELFNTGLTIVRYVQSSTNGGVNCVLEAWNIFAQNMVTFITGTKIHTRMLATNIGSAMSRLVAILYGSLVLIGDCSWWLVTLVPRTLFDLIIFVSDGFIFGFNAISRWIMEVALIIFEDAFRLSIGICIIVILIHQRRQITCLMKFLIFNSKVKLNSWLRTLRAVGWATLSFRSASSTRSSDIDLKDYSQFCVICRDNPKSIVLMPCKHLCLCRDCHVYMLRQEDLIHCPLCRSVIVEHISVYV